MKALLRGVQFDVTWGVHPSNLSSRFHDNIFALFNLITQHGKDIQIPWRTRNLERSNTYHLAPACTLSTIICFSRYFNFISILIMPSTFRTRDEWWSYKSIFWHQNFTKVISSDSFIFYLLWYKFFWRSLKKYQAFSRTQLPGLQVLAVAAEEPHWQDSNLQPLQRNPAIVDEFF